MVKNMRLATAVVSSWAAFLSGASAATVNFINKCSEPIELYHSESGSAVAKCADISVGSTHTRDVSGAAHMFRHGADTQATLVEFSIPSDAIWYDLSIIPPMPGYCSSYEDCRSSTGRTGFNIKVSMVPKSNDNGAHCRKLECLQDGCPDAYLFPMDNTKTHNCPAGTEFDVVFCPDGSAGGDAGTTSPVVTPAPVDVGQATVAPYDFGTQSETPASGEVAGDADYTPATSQTASQTSINVKSKYAYTGQQAGNVPGSYDMVKDLNGCVKETVTCNSPVGPMSEEVSMIFRGPMDLIDISVFTREGGNSTWNRVSSYSRDAGTTQNMVFMNNKNIDYSGGNAHGPQGLASADGLTKSESATVFSGYLAEASDNSVIGGGPGIQTGAEVNIMTGQPCDGGCKGYHGSNDYHGWDGGQKIFVTKVKMPQGSAPNQPAIWMLNAQVLHSNQYGCNCRGMGSVGGCGELDIAEVIETNAARDKVTTHYYFYDGSVLSPGGDNFAPRPVDNPTVYFTIIDDSGEGLIKIVEVDDFDFSQQTLDSGLYQQLLEA